MTETLIRNMCKNTKLCIVLKMEWVFVKKLTNFHSSVSFQYFLKRVSALKFPLTATEQYVYISVLSVKSIKLKMIIETKIGQNGRRSKCATFFALSGLR